MPATPPDTITIDVDPDNPFNAGSGTVAPAGEIPLSPENAVNVRPYVALVLMLAGWVTVTGCAFAHHVLAGIAWCGLTALAVGLGLAFEETT